MTPFSFLHFLLLPLFKNDLLQSLCARHCCIPTLCPRCPSDLCAHQLHLGAVSPEWSLASKLVELSQLSWEDLPLSGGFPSLLPIYGAPISLKPLYLPLSGFAPYPAGASWGRAYGHAEASAHHTTAKGQHTWPLIVITTCGPCSTMTLVCTKVKPPPIRRCEKLLDSTLQPYAPCHSLLRLQPFKFTIEILTSRRFMS